MRNGNRGQETSLENEDTKSQRRGALASGRGEPSA
jgi:hypothetical protein